MKLKKKSINEIADMICGNFEIAPSYFVYRSSSCLTEFFEECELPYVHDGSTRKWWVAGVLEEILKDSKTNPQLLPDSFIIVIRELMDQSDAIDEGKERPGTLKLLNTSLSRDGFQAYYDEHGVCQIRNTGTHATSAAVKSPQRAWTKAELETRGRLLAFLESASEDQITEKLLLPLFRQLGFQRITAAGHKDKALEYGKDVWMKYRLPTLHHLYFGIQVKKGKLDAAGKSGNANVAQVLAQIRMMLGHTVFDPETNRLALVDHAFIVAGGDITKQARNWLGERLDSSQRSQILFMDRNDILDLFLLHGVTPPDADPIGGDTLSTYLDSELPF